MGQLKSLRDLNLRRNQLTVLPEGELGGVHGGAPHFVGGVPMSPPRPELSELPLVRLDFSCNRVVTIPRCYRRLRHLQIILADNNPLQSPPAQVRGGWGSGGGGSGGPQKPPSHPPNPPPDLLEGQSPHLQVPPPRSRGCHHDPAPRYVVKGGVKGGGGGEIPPLVIFGVPSPLFSPFPASRMSSAPSGSVGGWTPASTASTAAASDGPATRWGFGGPGRGGGSWGA